MKEKIRWIPRTVTYGFVALLIAVCLLRIEAWPLTSLHLFSTVRTSESVALEMFAVSDDGRMRVLPGGGEVMTKTTRLFSQVPREEPERQREMVDAWLGAAHINKEDVRAVQIERVKRHMGESSADWFEVERELVWELVL